MTVDAQTFKSRLQAIPLFAEMEEFELLEFEIDLLGDPSLIAEDMQTRPSYLRV